MSKYYIPTIEQLNSNDSGFAKIYFETTGIRCVWNEKYNFNLFKRINKNNISILSSTATRSYNGEKHNKYMSLELNDNDEIIRYSAFDGSISSLHNENITYLGRPLILYYYIPIMKDGELIELIEITKSYDIRNKLYLKQIGEKYNLTNEMKRFINKY